VPEPCRGDSGVVEGDCEKTANPPSRIDPHRAALK
jgi:hypothetical protein